MVKGGANDHWQAERQWELLANPRMVIDVNPNHLLLNINWCLCITNKVVVEIMVTSWQRFNRSAFGSGQSLYSNTLTMCEFDPLNAQRWHTWNYIFIKWNDFDNHLLIVHWETVNFLLVPEWWLMSTLIICCCSSIDYIVLGFNDRCKWLTNLW